jgi:hypothetical protein
MRFRIDFQSKVLRRLTLIPFPIHCACLNIHLNSWMILLLLETWSTGMCTEDEYILALDIWPIKVRRRKGEIRGILIFLSS